MEHLTFYCYEGYFIFIAVFVYNRRLHGCTLIVPSLCVRAMHPLPFLCFGPCFGPTVTNRVFERGMKRAQNSLRILFYIQKNPNVQPLLSSRYCVSCHKSALQLSEFQPINWKSLHTCTHRCFITAKHFCIHTNTTHTHSG